MALGATSSLLGPRGAAHEDAAVAGRDLEAGNTLVTAKASAWRSAATAGRTDPGRDGRVDGQTAAQGVLGAMCRVWGEEQVATITSHLLAVCFWKRAGFSQPRSFHRVVIKCW